MNNDLDLLKDFLLSDRQRPVSSPLNKLLYDFLPKRPAPTIPSPLSDFFPPIQPRTSLSAVAFRRLNLPLYQPILARPVLSPIQAAFLRLKKNLELNESFDELIQQKHNAVRSLLEGKGVKDTKLIGSLQRETRIQPRSNDTFDIDILVILGEFIGWTYLGGISPSRAMEQLFQLVGQSDRYATMKPKIDQPTVLFEYKDEVKVELVPAYIDRIGYSPNGQSHCPSGRAYWIAKNGKWTLADYDHDATYISQQNGVSDDWLIPTIKMLKAIKRSYFDGLMDSIHLEILAAQTIPLRVIMRKILGLKVTYPFLLESFFVDAQRLVLSPIKIPGSHSPCVKTDYPYTLKSRFEKIAAYCRYIRALISVNDQLNAWKKLFGDPFTLE